MGSFGISEGNITERGKKEKNKIPQNKRLTATASGERTQMLAKATSKQGLAGQGGMGCVIGP